MDYSSLLDALGKASLFDLWRLKAALTRTLEDPQKNEAVRAHLRVGQSIGYFDFTENREILGQLIEIKRTRALIRHDHDQKLWNIPFYMLNVQGADTDTHFSRVHQKVNRDLLRVADAVGFRSRTNREVYGVVTQLNRKTATVKLTTGEQWRVAYGLLFYVLDAQAGTGEVIDLQITRDEPRNEEGPDQSPQPE